MSQGLIPILLVGAMLYLMILRPQRAMKRRRAELNNALSAGDEVVTIGGMHGLVRDVDDVTVDVEVAEGVIVRFDRRAIATIVRDVPEDEADEHRIGDEEDDDHDEVAESDDDDDADVAAEADHADVPPVQSEPETVPHADAPTGDPAR